MKTFIYESKYGKYTDCYFQVGNYSNGNLGIEIWSSEDGPITKVTVNPDIKISPSMIAVKDYSENEGMSEFLKRLGIINLDPVNIIISGWVEIPVYTLTSKGKEILGIKEEN